ncbi:hypothetical protein GCM10009850_047680 [Nonomuraea monospora]|uniref:Uncharacterized protein n=1 Tax=Nonomuraea monospora TaxID=568818 RepID=A0ABN3CJ93_9ACTN
MNPRERAEAIKDVCARDWRDKKTPVIEKARGQQRLEFYREPDFIYDKDGQIVGVDAWVRLYGPDGREVRVDPHRRIVNPPTVPRSGVQEVDAGRRNDRGQPIKDRTVTPDPLAAFYEAVWDSVEGAPNAKGWRTRGTVTTVFGHTDDGYLDANGASYAIARAGTGTFTGSEVGSLIWTGQYSTVRIEQGFVIFDTSSITDTDVVSSVVLEMYLATDNSVTDFVVEARETVDWGITIEGADYIPGDNLGGLTLLASISTAGIGATGAYKAFTQESAFNTMTGMKTDYVFISLSSSRTRLGIAPSGNEDVAWSSANASGTTQDPKLTITHSALVVAQALPVYQSRPNRIWRLH